MKKKEWHKNRAQDDRENWEWKEEVIDSNNHLSFGFWLVFLRRPEM